MHGTLTVRLELQEKHALKVVLQITSGPGDILKLAGEYTICTSHRLRHRGAPCKLPTERKGLVYRDKLETDRT